VVDVARYARQIALPEIGPEGQARISRARVAVIGADLTAETAATYLRAAGVGQVFEASEILNEPRFKNTIAQFDLVIRSGFDDAPMDGVAARLGIPVIFVRATPEAVDMVSFSGRAPSADARAEVPFKAAATKPASDGSAVLAGTLAAAEALQAIVREAAGPFKPRIRHLRLPLDGREPLVQEIGRQP
jgi:sulfur-carrier protein adenylyltransferase/sulfurtransferase